MINPLNINPRTQTNKIIGFLKKIQKKNKIDRVVVGLSGGIDSTLVLTLLTKAYRKKNIFVCYLPYSLPFFKNWDKNYIQILKIIKRLKIPKTNFYVMTINGPSEKIIYHMKTAGYSGLNKIVHEINDCFTCPNIDLSKRIRMGNILARLRMIFLFDQAKKHGALVCGTENRSEHLLGYYTRFGDGASDIEPIGHLYKTQVYQLAEYLKIPKEIINQPPTAGLWPCQTDEGEFGFTYQEADQVFHLYFDKKLTSAKIKKRGFKNVKKILDRVRRNEFKDQTPYYVD